jgi:hypothetical protein
MRKTIVECGVESSERRYAGFSPLSLVVVQMQCTLLYRFDSRIV